jgi:hypothetical protein
MHVAECHDKNVASCEAGAGEDGVGNVVWHARRQDFERDVCVGCWERCVCSQCSTGGSVVSICGFGGEAREVRSVGVVMMAMWTGQSKKCA